MALPNGFGQELLNSQAHVMNHIFKYINSMSLKCAVELGIPDIIHKHNKPLTISQLAESLSTNKAKTPDLARLMRLLEHSEFFSKDEDGGYSLTGASRLLVRGGPTSMVPLVAMLDPVNLDPYHYMSEWFKNKDASPFVTKHGVSFWDYAAKDQRLNALFNEAMAADAGVVGSVLGEECGHVFEGVKLMVDVAGGTGASARGIVAAFPGLRCIVLDLPHVVGGLEGCENLSFCSGDMFESIPRADAVFLKWILHDWTDEDCVKILKKCKEAIGPGGKVIIVDIVVDDQKQDYLKTETQLFFDVNMMVQIAGKERNEKEWSNLFYTAGFKNYKINHVLGLRSVIEVFP